MSNMRRRSRLFEWLRRAASQRTMYRMLPLCSPPYSNFEADLTSVSGQVLPTPPYRLVLCHGGDDAPKPLAMSSSEETLTLQSSSIYRRTSSQAAALPSPHSPGPYFLSEYIQLRRTTYADVHGRTFFSSAPNPNSNVQGLCQVSAQRWCTRNITSSD